MRLLGSAHAVAVISPTGKILHFANSEVVSQQEALERRVQTIDHGRTRRARHDGCSLRAWAALVDGRWSLVEEVESDGRRHYLAFENTPDARPYRALTARETVVVDQAVQGLSGKYIAYSTGLSPSRISEYLASAALKLGFRDRTELVRIAAALRSHGKLDLLGTPLTDAEREVWRLVNDGLSNAAIGAKRGTSVKTVKNQLASLFRKTGASGRRGLVAAAARCASWLESASPSDPRHPDL
jgi:DNA-binding CsgD family transcriptional regulator